MSKYIYIAKTKEGLTKNGSVTAPNEEIALTLLQSKELVVISIKDIKSQSIFGKNIEFLSNVSPKELVVFTRILSVFLEVQISLVEGISILREQNKTNRYFAEILDQIILDLQDGSLLSDAMAKHPKIFDKLFVSIVRSGEASGGLQESLLYMADYLENQYELNSKIRSALIYPSFVLVIFAVVGIIIAYFVLPQLVDSLTSIYVDSDKQLPWTTQAIISGSQFLREYIVLILSTVVAIIGGFIYFINTNTGKKWADRWKIKLPVFGKLFTKVYVARFANNMKNLLASGVPLISALEISSKVVGNSVFEGIINKSILDVKSGGQLSQTLLESKDFPYVAAQIISVGEKTGKTTLVLDTLTRFYKQEVDTLISNLSVLIEPIVIIFLGVGVGVFVISVLMPIYSVVGAI